MADIFTPLGHWFSGNWMGLIVGGALTKTLDFGYKRFEAGVGERGKRNKLRKFLYKELVRNYNTLNDHIRQYDTEQDEIYTVHDIRVVDDHYKEARRDLMLYDSLGDEARVISKFYNSFFRFQGKGGKPEHWFVAKAVRRSIEDDLRQGVLNRKLFAKCLSNDTRREMLKQVLDSPVIID